MTDHELAPAGLLNFAEAAYFLCTSEYRAIPNDSGGRSLDELIIDYEGRHFWSRIRSVVDAIADLNLFIERRELAEKTIEATYEAGNDQLGYLKYFDPDQIEQVLTLAYDAHELQALIGRLPSNHATADDIATSFDIGMANRPWLQLYEAVRFVMRGFPNGRNLNAFVGGRNWKAQNHPVWLRAYAGSGGEELFEQAQMCWYQSEQIILQNLREGEIVAESHGQKIPASLWQDYGVEWWKSELYPSPLARNERLTLPPLGTPVFGNILVEKRQLEPLVFAVKHTAFSSPQVSGSEIVSGANEQTKNKRMIEAEFYRGANRVVARFKGKPSPLQGQFEEALRAELPNVNIPRDKWRKFWRETYYSNALPPRGPRPGSSRK